MKTLKELRRVQNADERLNRDLAENVESNSQEPQGHGGGGTQEMPFRAPAEDFSF